MRERDNKVRGRERAVLAPGQPVGSEASKAGSTVQLHLASCTQPLSDPVTWKGQGDSKNNDFFLLPGIFMWKADK
jgi:hypothetical protein